MNKENWQERSNIAQQTLEKIFWNAEEKTYEPFTPFYEEEFEGFHYWWQAHTIDVLLDGYERTNDPQYINRIDLLLKGVLDKNNQKITNDFYDDMEWMALALLRAYQLTDDSTYLRIVEELWTDIMTGWNDICGGGFAWQKKQLYYKNTPANAPAVILALRLFQVKKDNRFLEQAYETYTWLEEHLVDPASGFIWDGMNRKQNMKIDKNWEFTYCQGVYVGACVEFYKLTKEKQYITKAKRTIQAAFDRLVDESNKNVLKSEGTGDGGLFKGIFIRYVEMFLQLVFDDEIFQKIFDNGRAAWKSSQHHPEKLFGEYWFKQNQDSSITLSTHLSGCMLMESIVRLQEKSSRTKKTEDA